MTETSSIRDPRPFIGASHATLGLPVGRPDHPDGQHIAAFMQLLTRELPELEAEVGCPIQLGDTDMPEANTPAILVGPATLNPVLRDWREERSCLPVDDPYVVIDRSSRRVIIDGPNLAAVGDAFQLLRTAIAEERNTVTPTLCESADAVIDRVDAEVRRTFPLLDTRAPGWSDAVAVARASMRDADDLETVQRLMANLGDAHSWAKDPQVNSRFPYALHVTSDETRFWDVPEHTVAWSHGVRPGDVLLAPDAAAWRGRTGTVERTRPWNVGYRAMQGHVGDTVRFTARLTSGTTAEWTEAVPQNPWSSPIETRELDATTGYMRVRIWLNGDEWRNVFRDALATMDRYDHLILDLRGNIGGALVAAQDARDHFLPHSMTVGSIRFSTVTGQLGAEHVLTAAPPESGPERTRPVSILVDPLCYSATEDFLLGLQGLPHIRLVGQQTGGGSGRPRTIRLRDNLIATISTALTYDRSGRCIEGNGFMPDVEIAPDPANLVDLPHCIARAGW